MAAAPKIVSERTLGQGRFLRLQTLDWTDATGTVRTWELASRTTGSGAVMMIVWLEPSDRLLLIRQYRPPAGGRVIEFPAGLIDVGESASAAAARELAEETGYTGRIVTIRPPAYNSPGLSDERASVVLMRVDEGAPENQSVCPDPQEGEDIEVILVRRADLPGFVKAEAAAGTQFDIKVTTYISALLDPA